MRVRPFQLVAALIAVCAIVIAVSMYLRRDPELSAAQMISYMPNRGSLYYLDLRALRDSGLLERFAGSAVAEEPEYRDFVTETAFDYKTDLDTVMGTSYQNTNAFLLRGRFDWKSLMSYVERNGGRCHNGFCNMPASRPNRIISFYAISRTLMGFAVSEAEFAAAEIKAGAGSSAGLKVPDHPMWISLPASALISSETLPEGTRIFAKALERADRVVFSAGSQGERFELAMDVSCKTDEDAAVLRGQLEGLTEIVRRLVTSSGRQPAPNELPAILSAGVFERNNRNVVGRWPVDRAFLHSLAPQ